MDFFEVADRFTAKWEGGYVNDPSDQGGETKYGISKKANPDVDISSLTEQSAKDIRRFNYWDANKLDELPPEIATAVYDFAINSGGSRAVKKLQKVIGSKEDGIIGPKTIAKLENSDSKAILKKYLNERETFLKGISTKKDNKKFLRGWLNRVNDLRKELGV